MMLKMGGFSASTRRLVYLAYVLLAVMAIWLVFLLLAEVGGSLRRPPSLAAASIVFVAFSLAWGLLLTGALYTRRPVRLGALFVYLIVTSVWVVSFVGFLPVYSGEPLLSSVSTTLVLIGAALLFTVPVYFYTRRRAQPSPVGDLAVLSLLVSATYATVYLQLVLIPNYVGDQLWINVSKFTLYPLLVLIELLFVILALDIVELFVQGRGPGDGLGGLAIAAPPVERAGRAGARQPVVPRPVGAGKGHGCKLPLEGSGRRRGRAGLRGHRIRRSLASATRSGSGPQRTALCGSDV
jgi:hypothetical protein